MYSLRFVIIITMKSQKWSRCCKTVKHVLIWNAIIEVPGILVKVSYLPNIYIHGLLRS